MRIEVGIDWTLNYEYDDDMMMMMIELYCIWTICGLWFDQGDIDIDLLRLTKLENLAIVRYANSFVIARGKSIMRSRHSLTHLIVWQ